MARVPFPWRRGNRGWYIKVNRKQVYLGRDRDEAFAAYHRMMGEQGRNPVPPGSLSVVEVFDRFIDWKSAKSAKRTADYYRTYLQSFADSVGSRLAESVIVHDVTLWIAAHPGWNPTTQSQVISAVQAAYRWATRQGLIGRNPIEGAERPAKLTRKLYLTAEQQADLLALARQKKAFGDIVSTMLFTGCRPQEARLVEVGNVREEHWLWHWDEGRAPKGKKARTVFLAGEAEDITRERIKGNTGPLFRGMRGDPWTADGLHSLFYRYGERLKIKGLKPYTLRHTYVTNALRNKANPEFLRVLIGHSSLEMIARTYSHIDQCAGDMKAAAMGAIGRSSA